MKRILHGRTLLVAAVLMALALYVGACAKKGTTCAPASVATRTIEIACLEGDVLVNEKAAEFGDRPSASSVSIFHSLPSPPGSTAAA